MARRRDDGLAVDDHPARGRIVMDPDRADRVRPDHLRRLVPGEDLVADPELLDRHLPAIREGDERSGVEAVARA